MLRGTFGKALRQRGGEVKQRALPVRYGIEDVSFHKSVFCLVDERFFLPIVLCLACHTQGAGPIAQMGEGIRHLCAISLVPHTVSRNAASKLAMCCMLVGGGNAFLAYWMWGKAFQIVWGRGGRAWGAKTLALWRREIKANRPPREPGVLLRPRVLHLTIGTCPPTTLRRPPDAGSVCARTIPTRHPRRARRRCSPAFDRPMPIPKPLVRGDGRQARPPRRAGTRAVAIAFPATVALSIMGL